MPIPPGEHAPTFLLDDAATGVQITDPWHDGPTVLAFFKVSCPVCQMAAPMVQALADGGVRVIAIGQDPPKALTTYAARYGQNVPTLTEPAPYRVSDAYRITSVPTLFHVGADGVIVDTIGSWDRERWNSVAAAWGGPPISQPGDGLPSFKPG